MKSTVRKEEQGTLRELEGCKDMNQEFNGQEVQASTLVETKSTRNDKDQL